jgi:hypothetical protein
MPIKICIECGDCCIATCPYCSAPVHQAYGFNNKNCGSRHEAKCPAAKAAREPAKK